MPRCLIGLGANLGNRRETLNQAVELLAQDGRLRLLDVSRWHETKPVGGSPDQPAYLNGVATVETTLAPRALLAVLHEIEDRLGRRRQSRWAPRSIDLDLLLHGDHVEQSASLVVPHPRMAWRRFVLEPASEVAASFVHPVVGWSVAQLLAHLDTSPPYVAVTGIAGEMRTRFARRVAERCAADTLLDSEPAGTKRSRALGWTAPARTQWHAIASRFHLDPSCNELSIGLECLRRRAQRLAAGDPRWSRPDRFTVGDFWFDESKAWAACRIVAGQQSLFFQVWRRLAPRVVRPKLVVLLDVSTKQWRKPAGASGSQIAIFKEQRRALDRQLRRQDVGPVLRLAHPESEESLEEVAAAIRATA
ncbi:MAG: 2-amino-4-hydroxy-6-hydroxymethyldihydropteridine diphosphokinase [Pirellulales bacterium]|nr:2-amino-4-hydroxy-6-hydroxymethyldihydropteridine diphosphokinase [Pirellulales bacterium]